MNIGIIQTDCIPQIKNINCDKNCIESEIKRNKILDENLQVTTDIQESQDLYDRYTFFLIFAGDTYYANGGWNDFYSSAETIEEAQYIYNSIKNKYDWVHVVDMWTKHILIRSSDEKIF